MDRPAPKLWMPFAGLAGYFVVTNSIVAVALIGAIKEVFYHLLVVEHEEPPDRAQVTRRLLDLSLRGLMPARGADIE